MGVQTPDRPFFYDNNVFQRGLLPAAGDSRPFVLRMCILVRFLSTCTVA